MNANEFVRDICELDCDKVGACIVYQFLNNIPQIMCLSIDKCNEFVKK